MTVFIFIKLLTTTNFIAPWSKGVRVITNAASTRRDLAISESRQQRSKWYTRWPLDLRGGHVSGASRFADTTLVVAVASTCISVYGVFSGRVVARGASGALNGAVNVFAIHDSGAIGVVAPWLLK